MTEAAYNVSTHASAGDATKGHSEGLIFKNVSTHASAGDATPRNAKDRRRKKFQLTRPRGTRRVTTP